LLPCLPAATSLQGQQQLLPTLAVQNPRRGTSLTESLPGFYFPVFCWLQSDRQKFSILPHGLVEVSDSATSLFSGNLWHWKSPNSIAMNNQCTRHTANIHGIGKPIPTAVPGAPLSIYSELLSCTTFPPSAGLRHWNTPWVLLSFFRSKLCRPPVHGKATYHIFNTQTFCTHVSTM